MKTTPNLGLRKPDQEDFYNVDDFNYNADVIDQEIVKRIINSGGVPSVMAGVDANKPTPSPIPGAVGRLYVATDTQIIYRDTGTVWEKISVVNWADILGKPQQGTVMIYNKLVVEGCIIGKVSGTRNTQITKTGTFTVGNASRVYIDGKDVLIYDEQNVAMVPTNPGSSAVTYYAYLAWDSTQGKYRVYVGTTVPDNALSLYKITVPAGDQAINLDACTFTDQRRLEPGHPYYYSTKPFALVSPSGYPMLDTPDYDVLLTVESASDLDKVGRLEVYDKASNGFKIRPTGTADNVQVRWIIVNPDIA